MKPNWPKTLTPNSLCILKLKNSQVKVGVASPQFPLWGGPMPKDTYGGKPIIDLNGKPTFAELYILQLMKGSGWDGIWIDSFKKKFRVDFENANMAYELPELPKSILERILSHSDFPRTCWDLFCWNNKGQVVFIEAKRKSKDRIQDSQIIFIDKAIKSGVSPEQFLIVEWTAERTNPPEAAGIVDTTSKFSNRKLGK